MDISFLVTLPSVRVEQRIYIFTEIFHFHISKNVSLKPIIISVHKMQYNFSDRHCFVIIQVKFTVFIVSVSLSILRSGRNILQASFRLWYPKRVVIINKST